MVRGMSSLVELLQKRAIEQPEQVAYTLWSENGEQELTYAQLDLRARALGALLQAKGAEGERALLLYPPGLEYVVAFFGCLYGGVLAVPAYPPRQNGNLGRLQAIVSDADAKFALTTETILTSVEKRFAESPGMEALKWLVAEEIDPALADLWIEPDVGMETLAFLQYTSGSTSAPKGVMLTHGNLLHNLEMIEAAFGTSAESRGVVWLPPYHDMGLIGGILQPLFTGYGMTLMPPVDFIQKPLRWLQAISQTKATVSGGPNFAYELCLQKITPEQRDTLDLSSWENAFTGAEPVRAETLERFAEFFAPCGFRKEAFYPCYGLAEATLFISGGAKEELPHFERVEAAELTQNRVAEAKSEQSSRLLVSCGHGERNGQKVLIVDGESGVPCADGQVGEIWVHGPNVARGYWNREAQTKDTFQAVLATTGEGPFLRTGDLGFAKDGGVYITGRMKDLIIIRGRNYYPQDLEFTVQESHEAVRNSNGAAFAVEIDGEERLVVVQELERAHRKGDHAAVIASMRQAVSEEHQLQLHAVLLIKPASIPKTSSGKIQRYACRDRYLAGTLEVVAGEAWQGAVQETVVEPAVEVRVEDLQPMAEGERQAALEALLTAECADVMQVAQRVIEPERSLHALGMDSLMAVELKHRVETAFTIELTMAEVLDGPSVRELARVVEKRAFAADKPAERAVEAVVGTDASPEQVEFPLTYGQQAMYFMQSLAPDSGAYHISNALRIAQALDVERLRAAFAGLVARHPQLRARFEMQETKPVQRVAERVDVSFATESAAELTEEQLMAQVHAEANRPFDLANGPMIRMKLWSCSDSEHLLLITAHHIAVDFWSFGVLLQEFGELYAQVDEQNGAQELVAIDRYREFVRDQQELLQSAEGTRLEQFWRERVGRDLSMLHLPGDRPRPAVLSDHGAEVSFVLPVELTEALRALAKELGATLYVVLLSAFQVLLHRYTGQEDVVIGSPSAGRNAAKFAGTVGYFVNPVVLRGQVCREEAFAELVEQVRKTVLEALKHQEYPFPLLVEKMQPNRDLSYPPLFNVMFNLQSGALWKEEGLVALALGVAGAKIETGGLVLETVALDRTFTQFDLSLMMGETEGSLRGVFAYSTALFDQATVERMVGHFEALLGGIVKDAKRTVAELPLVTAKEHEQLRVWNGEVGTLHDLCLHQLVEAQVLRTPQEIAVVFEGETLTFAALNARANQLAHALRAQGVTADVPVGIFMERSLELVIGLLAVLKAGGAYVPLDPSYPQERIGWIAEDTQLSVVLTQEALVERIPVKTAHLLCLDRDRELLAAHSETNLETVVKPTDLAYILYTSGSTGRPKGVEIPHRAIVNHMLWMIQAYPLDRTDKILQKTPIGFDASVWEFWAPLLSGAQLVMARPGGHRDSGYLVGAVKEQGITVLQLVPTMLGLLLDEPEIGACTTLRHVFCGGEALSVGLQDRFFQLVNAELHNLYGPTECTIDATVWDCEREQRSVPIGRPITNTQVYVLDADLRPVPALVAGELHIGGAGLARGYRNRPDLTAEKFIPHPFANGERIYKTGDLARYLPDGTLEYLGRLDQQVKIRGFRIELGEIEAVLIEHSDVREAVVTAHEEAGDQRLIAYLTCHNTVAAPDADLRGFLKQKLPEYMVPSAFVVLEALPLLPNGKVDLKSLPVPERGQTNATAPSIPPRTPTEVQLAGMWCEVLGIERVGIADNFFELGGHSLLAMQIVTRIRKQFGVELPVARLFETPTIAELALVVDSSKDVPKVKKMGMTKLSRAAHRIDQQD